MFDTLSVQARGDSREAQFAGQRRELAQVHHLLAMLHTRGLTIRSANQTTLDGWLADGPLERLRVKAFLRRPAAPAEELGTFARQAVERRGITRFGGSMQDHEWLFPSPLHGRAIGPVTLSRRLSALGVRSDAARTSALGNPAQQLLPPILARLTGLAPSVTVGLRAAVSASYAANLPSRGRPGEPALSNGD